MDGQIIDVKELKERLEDNFELYQELAGIFFNDSERIIDELQDSVTREDFHKIGKLSHTLMGAVANFSAYRAYNAARTLEVIGKDQKMEEAPIGFEKLKTEINILKKEMKLILEKGIF